MTIRPSRMILPAALGGLVAALVLLAMPVGLVETVVASSGLSEAWPAAAPPLGLKARLLIAGFGALMVMGFAWVGRGSVSTPLLQYHGRRDGVQGVSDMGFALSKLGWLSRGRNMRTNGGRPALRRADAHPDAPARAPIFASRDFDGLDIFPRISPARVEPGEQDKAADQPVVVTLPLPASQTILAPDLPDVSDADFEEVVEVAQSATPVETCAQPLPPPSPPQAEPMTLADLTARLERGLAQRERHAPGGRGVIADMPVEQAVPVRERVEDEVDQALRAALGTLRAMAGRTR